MFAMFCIPWAANAQTSTLTVYDGTTTNNYVPAYIYYFDDYTRSQFVIPADALTSLGDGAVISEIAFYCNQAYPASGKTQAPVDVYIMEVNYTSISAFEATSSATTVYSGVLSTGDDNVMTITFATPYTYHNGNLLIGLENTEEASYQNVYFYGQTVNGASVAGSGSSLADVSATQRNFIPKTTLTYIPGEQPACPKPTDLTITYTGGTTAEVSWTSGNVMGWNIDVNGHSTAVTQNPFTLTDLDLGTTYSVKVQAICGFNDLSEWTSPKSFTTDLCMPEDQCEIAYTLMSQYGSWYGAAINVVDVTTGAILAALTCENDETGVTTGTLSVCNGRNLRFEWVAGEYDTYDPESMFYGYYVYNANDEEILSGEGEVMSEAVTYNMVCPSCIKPKNLAEANITINSVDLSWEGSNDSYVLQYRPWNPAGDDIITTGAMVTYTVDLSEYEGIGSVAIRHYDISDMFQLIVDNIEVTNAAGTVVYSQDFESCGGNMPSEFSNMDLDGDGFTWQIASAPSSNVDGSYGIVSESYNNDYGALTPDNWLILSGLEMGGQMTFQARGQDPAYAAENFAIYVSTESSIVEVPVATTSYQAQNLQPNTPYAWQVKGVCGEEQTNYASSFFKTKDDVLVFAVDGDWNVVANWKDADGNAVTALPTTSNNVRIDADVEIPANVVAQANKVTINGGSITIKDGGQLKQSAATLRVTMEKNITAYGTGAGNYYFFGSPFNGRTKFGNDGSTWSLVDNILEGDYNLYAFDPTAELEWINYEDNPEHISFLSEPTSSGSGNPGMLYGEGYLYANQEGTILEFIGTTGKSNNYVETRDVTYDSEATDDWNGWMLVGNMFTCNGYINYVDDEGNLLAANLYVMNATGDGFELASSNMLAPLTAAFMQVNAAGKIQYSTEPIDASPALSSTNAPCLPALGEETSQDGNCPVPCETIVLTEEAPTKDWTFEGITTATEPYTGEGLGNCWTWTRTTEIGDLPDTLPHLYNNSEFAHSGDYSLRLWFRGVYAMPELAEGVNINRVKMSFWSRHSYPFYTMMVGVMTDPTNPSTFEPVAYVDNGSSTGVKYFEFDFSKYDGQGRYIAFKNVRRTNNELDGHFTDLHSVNYIDDITLTLMPETDCTIELADLPYTENFDAITSSTNTETGATPVCWEVVKEDAAMSLVTAPQVYYSSSYAYNGNYSLRMVNRGVYAMPTLAEDIDINKVRLSMYVRQPNALYQLQVGVWDEVNETFTPVASVNNSTTGVEKYICDFSNYDGTGRRIAFRNVLGGGKTWSYSYNYIDNVVLSLAECAAITETYTESFETVTTNTSTAATGAAPSCWEIVEGAETISYNGYPQVYYNSDFAETGSYSLRMSDRCVYAMPEFADGVNIGDLSMTMYVRQPYSFYQLEVGVWNGTEFTVVETVNNSDDAVTEVTVDFGGYEGTGRVAFRNSLNSGKTWSYSYNYIDEISFTVNASKMSADGGNNLDEADVDRYLDNISVYPNPTMGVLHIDAMDVQKVECYSQMGQLVGVYDNVNELNISELADGVYMLRITVPQGVTMRKVVKR